MRLSRLLPSLSEENGSAESGRLSAGNGPAEKWKEDVTNIKRNDALTRQGCSYSSVLMKDMVDAKRKVDEVVSEERVVNVHKETSAFFDLQGRAVVRRVKDFGCLISMKDNLSKAGVSGSKLYYLGGLIMMLAFEDDIEATDFILNVNMWKEWFASLDIWSEWPELVNGEDEGPDYISSPVSKSDGQEVEQPKSFSSVHVVTGKEGDQRVHGDSPAVHVSSDVSDINVGPFPMLVGKEGIKGGLFDEAGVGTQPVHIPGINSDAGVNVAGRAKIGEIISEGFNLGYGSNKKNGMRKPKLLAQTRVTKPQGVSPGIKRPLKRPRQNDEDHFCFPLPGSNSDSGNPKGVNRDTGLSPSAGLLDLNLRASSAETLVDDPHPADS
ncbi:hypothetical protein L1987_58754 [Smallanthus sonchifolius]|uniref:Uncharacterized protein n=1 Tax=Smallanthus sonchifolius TaxID=185202 RepID=A0ACB9D472_9ASTR|nr:hypothetical protein L1987_58754 [Smallanthus sonchifolius]